MGGGDPRSASRSLGFAGSLMMVLAILPHVGVLLGISGFVLVLIALKYYSEASGDSAVFNNALISVAAGILGLALAALTFMGALVAGGPAALLRVAIGALLALIVVWLAAIVSSLFLRRSYASIVRDTGIQLFDTAALLYLIGAVLSILLVGFILIFVALIIQAIAFLSIPSSSAAGGPAPATSANS